MENQALSPHADAAESNGMAGNGAGADPVADAGSALARLSYLEQTLLRDGERLDAIKAQHSELISRASFLKGSQDTASANETEAVKPQSARGRLTAAWRLWWLSFFAKSWIWHLRSKRRPAQDAGRETIA